ncbi:MAG: hypothetical protein RLZZ445_1381 [Pseudomonadota bacterium]|jgi:hypothetical protein
MTMKPTELQKYNALKIVNKMKKAATPGRFGGTADVVPDRREQRRLDQAAGLIPFAVKLNRDLVAQVNVLAQERKVPVNDVVAELLQAALKK